MIHHFLDFELDETLFELRRHGKPLEIQARVFATLLCLVRNRGRIITRDELTQSVWKDTVVSDAAISQVIMLARKVLGDAGPNPQIIRTIRGRGFRFAPPVTIRAHVPAPAVPVAAPAPATDITPAAVVASVSAPAKADAEFVGRQEELNRLMHGLDRAGRGRGGMVLLEGEPGSGRSSLVRELAKRASARGVEAAWGRAWEAAGTPRFWPWTAVVRALVQRRGLDRVRALGGDYAHELAPVAPELAPSAATPSVDLDNVQARFRLFGAMSRLLRAVSLASDTALLIILEDVHCADAASLQLLRYMSEEVADMPLLIVATLDELAPHVADHLTNLLPWTAAHMQRIRLRGLSRAEASRLLEAKLGAPAPARLAQSIYELSAGNPLLLHGLCSRLRPDALHAATFAAWDLASYPLPERIVASVRRQLADLPSHTLHVLGAASVFGREFRVPWLAALLELTEAELIETLTPGLQRSVLQANTPQFGVWTFSHAMVRGAVYTALPVRERFDLHARVAALLEQRSPDEPASLHAIAHNYLLAGPGPARDKAIAYARRAADQARGALGFEEAAHLYDHVVDLLEVSLEREPAPRLELLMLAADAWYRAGQLKRASLRFERAAALARQLDRAEDHGRALCMAVLVMRASQLHDAATQQQLAHALERLPAAASGVKALLIAASAFGHGSQTARDTQTAAAVAMARQVGDQHALAWTLSVRHRALWGVARAEDLLQLASEMLEVARALHHDELLLDAQLWRMLDRIELGQLAQALHDQREYVAVANPARSSYHTYMRLMLEAAEATSGGQCARALELSERAYELGKQLHEPLAQAYYEVRCLFLQTEPSGGSEHTPSPRPGAYVEPPSCVPSEYHAFWGLGWLRSGHEEHARALLDELVANAGELPGVSDGLRRPVWAVLARVAARLQHRPAAAILYSRLAHDADRHLLLQAGVYLGPVSYYLGSLAAVLDRTADATRHFEQALEASARSLTFLARTQFEYAQLLAKGPGPRRRAEQLLHEAEVNARQTGLADLLEQLKAPFDVARTAPRPSYA